MGTEMGPDKRSRIHEYLSFRAAVDTDAVTAAAAHTEGSKVRFARDSLARNHVLDPKNLPTCRLLGTDWNRKIPSVHLSKAGRVEPH